MEIQCSPRYTGSQLRWTRIISGLEDLLWNCQKTERRYATLTMNLPFLMIRAMLKLPMKSKGVNGERGSVQLKKLIQTLFLVYQV